MNDERKTKRELIAELKALREHGGLGEGLARLYAEVLEMRERDDMLSLVANLLVVLCELGFKTGFASIDFVDREARTVDSYQAFLPQLHSLSSGYEPPVAKGQVDENGILTILNPSLEWASNEWIWLSDEAISIEIKVGENTEGVSLLNDLIGIDNALSRAPDHWLSGNRTDYAHIINVPFPLGSIGYVASGLERDQVEIVSRLAEPLAVGYMRYLDFRAVEEQATRLERERAVERVRAEVMAMRSSADLIKVVAVLYQEINHLGVDTPHTAIVLVDDVRGQLITYNATDNPEKLGLKWSSSVMIAYDENTIAGIIGQDSIEELDEFIKVKFEAWENGEVSAGEFPNLYEIVESNNVGMLGLAANSPYTNAFMNRSEGKVDVTIPFKDGWIGYFQVGRDEEKEAIVRDLVEALSFGYLRYLDFQKIDEAQRQLIDELEEELQTAHELQMGLMPTESPDIEGLDIAGHCIPANHVGGDFFQYFQQDGKLSICMADVTGHAMEAAVPVLMFSGILESEMRHGEKPDALFAHLNRTLHSKLDKRTFVCFTVGELEGRTLRVANGGCPYPYLYRAAENEVEELQVDAYPLGVRAEAEYALAEVELQQGDRVVFCSDGLIEAENVNGELFGFERMQEAVRQGGVDGLSADGLIERIVDEVKAFAGEAAQGDDMTCVVLGIIE